MIIHIAMYQLKDKTKKQDMIQALKTLETCPLIQKNMVQETCFPQLPTLPSPLFGDVAHIAAFKNMEDATNYPESEAHQQLMKQTNAYIQQVMTMDFVDETNKLI